MPIAIKPILNIKVQFASLVFLALAFVSQLSMSCVPFGGRQNADSLFLVTSESEIYYDLKNPSEKYLLPFILEEISGLSFSPPNSLVMLEDEGGKVYEYNYMKREIVSSTSFTKPGDFEGVELVNSNYYAIKSNGELYKFGRNEGKRAEAKKIKTPLSRKNDVEGLGYDFDENRLLIITKANGDFKDHKIKGNGIFAYDLKEKDFKKKAIIEISTKKLADFLTANKDQEYDLKRLRFHPSGIAFHPIEKTYYVIAALGKMMLVFDKTGAITSSYSLSPIMFRQPEGICFSSKGELFISSEGDGNRGYVLRFPMLKK